MESRQLECSKLGSKVARNQLLKKGGGGGGVRDGSCYIIVLTNR